MYTVKQLSALAGVSVRTLHYYDEIGLLPPARTGDNGYRYYDESSLLRLQQVLFYRELGLDLAQIKAALDSPDFDTAAALRSHRGSLRQKIARLQQLVQTVDRTLHHLEGGTPMSNKSLFEGFSEEKQKDYTRIARLKYGPENVNESIRRWNSYSETRKAEIMAEAGQVYTDMAAALEAEVPADSPEIEAILDRWQANLRHFYEPTLEVLRGLGETYGTDPAFRETFVKFHPLLPEFLYEAIAVYVDRLETAALEQMIAEDEERAASE